MDLTSVVSKLWLTLVQVWLQLTLHLIARFDFISEETYYVSNENLMYITGVFLYLNSTINPIIYNVISAKYRKAFKETLFTPSKGCRYADLKLSIFVESIHSKYSATIQVCKDNPDSIAIPTQLAQVPHYMLVYSQDQTLEHAFVFSGTVPSQLPILWPLIFSSQ